MSEYTIFISAMVGFVLISLLCGVFHWNDFKKGRDDISFPLSVVSIAISFGALLISWVTI